MYLKADGGSILALGTRRRLGGALEASWSGPKSSPEDPKRVPGRPKHRKRRSTQHEPPSSYLGASSNYLLLASPLPSGGKESMLA